MLTPDFLNHGMDRFTDHRPKNTGTALPFFRACRSDGQRPPNGNRHEETPSAALRPSEANPSTNAERAGIDAARSLLKEKGFLVISQRAFDDIIAEKYTKAYEKARQEVRQNAATESPDGKSQATDTALSSLEHSIRQQGKNAVESAATAATTQTPLQSANMLRAETDQTLANDSVSPAEIGSDNSIESIAGQGDSPDTNSDAQSLAQIIQHYESLLERERAQGQQAQSQLAQWQQAQKTLLLKAAIQPWAIDPELVFSLTETLFELQPHGGLGLVAAAGNSPAGEGANESETPLDLARFFAQFRAERPYLVKASASHGAGSLTEVGATGDTVAVTLEQLAELPMEQFIRAGGLSGNTR